MTQTELRCTDCRTVFTWNTLRHYTIPDDEEEEQNAVNGDPFIARTVCPGCGNDTFDRLDTEP